jgi:hypothetical protein
MYKDEGESKFSPDRVNRPELGNIVRPIHLT